MEKIMFSDAYGLTPIIDPSTLSEEQREAIRRRYALMKRGITECEAYELGFVMDEYKVLFGSEFFKSSTESLCSAKKGE